jgi:hypothetical protein
MLIFIKSHNIHKLHLSQGEIEAIADSSDLHDNKITAVDEIIEEQQVEEEIDPDGGETAIKDELPNEKTGLFAPLYQRERSNSYLVRVIELVNHVEHSTK